MEQLFGCVEGVGTDELLLIGVACMFDGLPIGRSWGGYDDTSFFWQFACGWGKAKDGCVNT